MVSYLKINENLKKKGKNPVSRLRNNPIYALIFTWISTWTELEALVDKGQFLRTSN